MAHADLDPSDWDQPYRVVVLDPPRRIELRRPLFAPTRHSWAEAAVLTVLASGALALLGGVLWLVAAEGELWPYRHWLLASLGCGLLVAMARFVRLAFGVPARVVVDAADRRLHVRRWLRTETVPFSDVERVALRAIEEVGYSRHGWRSRWRRLELVARLRKKRVLVLLLSAYGDDFEALRAAVEPMARALAACLDRPLDVPKGRASKVD
jgi:hypothetical protein